MSASENQSIKDDDFRLSDFISFVIKNKKAIGLITILGTLFSGLYISRIKDIWYGEFQIVLNTEKPKTFQNLASEFSSLGTFGLDIDAKDDLMTQVEVLKSPSILLDIFEFAKKEKVLNNPERKNMRFESWKKNFQFTLKKKTSVLTLSYKDEDKDLIIPILNKISNKFQDYSGKKRKRQIVLGTKYYENQIAEFKIKTLDSMRKAQLFGIENNLSVISKPNSSNSSEMSQLNFSPIVDVEEKRIKSVNVIKEIDQQIPKVISLEGVANDALFLTSLLRQLSIDDSSRLPFQIEKIDSEIASRSSLYKKNDPGILKLTKEKDLLTQILKDKVLSLLNAKRDIAISQLKSSEREPEVVITFKRLFSNSLRDQFTYNQLLNEYRALKLFKSQDIDPWELITSPTRLPNPVAPNRQVLSLFAITLSFLIGCLIPYFRIIIKEYNSEI